jgi:hypothetical protein
MEILEWCVALASAALGGRLLFLGYRKTQILFREDDRAQADRKPLVRLHASVFVFQFVGMAFLLFGLFLFEGTWTQMAAAKYALAIAFVVALVMVPSTIWQRIVSGWLRGFVRRRTGHEDK